MDRCYNEKHKRYHLYGGNGVHVCEEWQTLNGFIATIDLVEGFDMDLYMQGEIALDKDSKDINNLCYSVEKCKFISLEENNKYKPNQQRKAVAISPDGKRYEFYNQSEFARNHNLTFGGINACLNNKAKTHKKWTFYFE